MGVTFARAAEPGLITKHLMGEYSLARSFWVHTMALALGLNVAGALLIRYLSYNHALRYASIFMLVFQVGALLVWAWSNFGTWIAAIKHFANGGGRLWALLTMVALSFGAMGMMRHVAELKPLLTEHWDMAWGRDHLERFTVSVSDDGRVVAFQGDIREGASAALASVLAQTPQARTVSLQSRGGWLIEGQRIERLIRKRHLDTHVVRGCLSACTLALMGGRERTAERGAAVGFHSGRPIGGMPKGRASLVSSDEAELYRQAGLSDAFIRRVQDTPFEDMWIPDRQELLDAGVLTR